MNANHENDLSPANQNSANWDGELLSSKYKRNSIVEKVAPYKSRFSPIKLADVISMPPQQFIVQNLLPKQGLAVWFGAPGCGKTFLALDLALSLTHNFPQWFGRDIAPSSVVYVAGEGLPGISNRLRSWLKSKLTSYLEISDSVHFVATPPNLFQGETGEFCVAISSLNPGLIIFDTFARSAVGAEENSSKDMGKFIQGCDYLSKEFCCCVLILHHSGRGGWERGSTALRGAADLMLEIKKHKDGIRELCLNGQLAKLKDGPESESIYFRLATVDESCVVESVGTFPTSDKSVSPKGEKQKLVLKLIRTALKGRSEGEKLTLAFDELHDLWKESVTAVRDREPNSLKRVLKAMLSSGLLEGSESSFSIA